MGAAAGVVEPVLGNALTLLHDALRRLVGLLPNDPGDMTVEAHEYNRLTRLAYEGARDAAVAVWATNARAGEPLWDLARDAAPPTLARRLALYRSRGYVPPAEDHDALTPADWSMLLDGQGIRPRRLHPLAAAIPAGAALAHVGRVHGRLSAAAAAMPTHAAVLARMEESR